MRKKFKVKGNQIISCEGLNYSGEISAIVALSLIKKGLGLFIEEIEPVKKSKK
jgi:hypothetical protein